MKKAYLFIIACFIAGMLNAQTNEVSGSPLATGAFWQSKPDAASVKTELAKGFDFTHIENFQVDPLFLAINNDAPVETIELLASQPGVDMKRTVHEGRSYLHIAASKGNASLTAFLLKKGADMYFLDANGHTALTFAAFGGHLTLPVLQAFVQNGLDVKKKYASKEGANIMMLAVGFDKDLTITNYLVSKGLSLQSTDDFGNGIFSHAAKVGNLDILKALLQKGVKYNENTLFLAAQGTFRSANKLEVYQYLVDELKLDPLAINKAGQNVLHFIVRKQNQADVITYFFNKGVDINKTDSAGNTPFIGAAGTKSPETVTLLLPKVKNINAVNAKGESALLNAVKSSNGEVVALLLKNGADSKIVDKQGNSLAFYLVDSYRGRGGRGGAGAGAGGRAPGNAAPGASAAGTPGAPNAAPAFGGRNGSSIEDFAEKLKVLQAAGLDLAAPQKDGNTLYHLAIAKNDLELLKKLDGLGIDINAVNKEGYTVLHKAAMLSKDDAILQYLVSIGAKKEVKTSFGETAYDLAGENGFLKKEKTSIDFLK